MRKLYPLGNGRDFWPHLGFPSLSILLFECCMWGWGRQVEPSFSCSLILLLQYASVCLKLVVTCLLSIKAPVISLLPILFLYSRYLYPAWFLKTLLKLMSQLTVFSLYIYSIKQQTIPTFYIYKDSHNYSEG